MLFDAVISPPFLSAAKPSGQGEESVLLIIVWGGGHFQSPHEQFLRCEKCQLFLFKNGCEKSKVFLKKGEKKTIF